MKNVRLFIGDKQVDFTTEPDILFNFNVGDLSDPTAVKNSFTKQIQIEGTQHNNDLFGDIWQLDRATQTGNLAYTGIYFNASKKVPFQLFNNGEVYQEGYCKLDNIERQYQKIVYTVSLYGGLGEYFYNLMYVDTDEASGENTKKTLADLDFGKDLSFTINKQTVKDAWTDLGTNANSKWQIVNFAPAYNGYPEDFSADKALVNVRSNPYFDTSKTSGGTTYGSYGGYEMAALPQQYTDIETRDLRSYLQRPVIRMKSIIDACCNPNNNGGYTVYKDPLFFNDNNPYYEKTWVTMPMLNEYEYVTSSVISGYSPTITVTRGTPTGNSSVAYNVAGIEETVQKVTLNVKPTLSISSQYEKLYSAQIVNWKTPSRWLDPFTYVASESGVMQILGGIGVQARAYLNGKIVCSSDWVVFETRVEGKYYVPGARDGKKPKYIFGYWDGSIAGSYIFKKEDTLETVGANLTLNLNNRPYDSIKIVVETLCNDSSEGTRLFDTVKYTNSSRKQDNCRFTGILQNNYDAMDIAFVDAEQTEYSSLSDREIPQDLLLDTKNSPADYLLSFTKMFGLYFLKEPDEKKISILTRHTFYHRNEIKDLTGLIDRSKAMTITPVVMDTKWYDWKQEMVESMYADNYNKTTSMTYGMKRINTGYEFNAEAKNLYDSNIFNGCVEALEKSRMYSMAISGDTTDTGATLTCKQWMVDGFDLTMYQANYDPDDDTNNKTLVTKYDELKGLQPINAPKWPFYDLFPKAQFRDEDNGSVAGENVLLFFLDKISTTTTEGVNLRYWLTDDLPIMLTLNDNSPCWLYTTVSADTAGKTIALPVTSIPRFGRYVADENTNVIQWSLDFGEVRQLYIPSYSSEANSTIYNNFWKSYIEDLYDVDTKVVEAYVRLTFKPSESLMRDFYYFDNSIWRINKISDWNLIKEDTTKVQFVKVKDINNYDSIAFYGSNALVLSANKSSISVEGEDVTFTVTTLEPDMVWYGYDNWRQYFGSVPSGIGNGTFTYHMQAHPSMLSSTVKLAVYCEKPNVSSNQLNLTRQGAGLGAVGFLLPENITVPTSGGQYRVKLYYNGWNLNWEIISNKNWVTASPSTGTSHYQIAVTDEDITITVAENTGTTRTATLTVNGTHYNNTLTIVQEGAPAYLNVSPADLGFPADTPLPNTFNISSNTDWTITVEEN